MTVTSSEAPTPVESAVGWRLGVVSTSAIGIVLLAWALTTDLPKMLGGGFFSDGATYYSLAHSIATDGDFEFRREDLLRIWREFPGGPEGIFLKRGRDIQGVRLTSSFPFAEITTTRDWDGSRLYYGKSFVFPLFAAPFVWLFGTTGFLVLHALLMTICFACAYAFLAARSTPVEALVFAVAFLFVSVAPVYMVWLNSDFFNFAMVLIAYFFWCYKEVAAEPSGASPWWLGRWTRGLRSDVIAVALLGLATFSKPTHALLIGPVLALFLLRRQWRRGAIVAASFAIVTAGLFAWNAVISGEWNYQGGEERSTFYSRDLDASGPRIGGFPFLTEKHTFDTTGLPRETNRVPIEVLTSSDAVRRVLLNNVRYFLVGRYAGFVPYFFPAVVACALLLARARNRPSWQWLTLLGGVGSAIFLLLYMPFTYSGGGGPVGNRYFLGVYPVFLFVTPPRTGLVASLIALGVGALFTAQLTFNPFYASTRAGEHAKLGLFRMLPPELTLLNDLPIELGSSKWKQSLGGVPPVYAYFLDDNVYRREKDAFWVRGESRAEIILRAHVVHDVTSEGEVIRPLRVPRLAVLLETGAVPNRVTINTGAHEQTVDLPAHEQRWVTVRMPEGLPYKPFPELPTNYVYFITVESQTGFIPMFQSNTADNRFLGVFVRVVPQYE